MEVLKSFLIIIVVVLSFGVAIIAGQNGLLSARCAARCLKEHKDSLRQGSDRNDHRKFLLDRCKEDAECFQCMKPCAVSKQELVERKCERNCKNSESLCKQSCLFLYYIHTFKAGDCPKPETATGFEAVCLPSCRIDGDCRDSSKCCANMCGYACREPSFTGYGLPKKPVNITLEERRKGRSLKVTWNIPEKNLSGSIKIIYVLEHRKTTSVKPVWKDNTPWETMLVTPATSVLIRRINAGHWYEFRVASATEEGSQGYSIPSSVFKSSRNVQVPSAPQNITEGVTTLRKGNVDLTIHWQPPRYSDIPVWKYTITWRKILSGITPVLVRIPLFEKSVPGHVHEFKLKKLLPGTTYHIEIEALVQYGNRQLRSRKANKSITTYAPPKRSPNGKLDLAGVGKLKDDWHGETDKRVPYHLPENPDRLRSHVVFFCVAPVETEPYPLYKDIIKVENLHVIDGLPYFDQGSLKAKLSWNVGKGFSKVVKSFMIYWTPKSCDQPYAIKDRNSATSDVPSFEVYDLQYECHYTIEVSAVTKTGVQCRPSKVQLTTPICQNILVKSNSLAPDCPERVPQVPNSPRNIGPTILKKNCSVFINLTWSHPNSDLPITGYLVEYEVSSNFRGALRETDGSMYKEKPTEILLGKVTTHTVKGLEFSELYVIRLFAVSRAGRGDPAFVEILTPKKDNKCAPPEEPDLPRIPRKVFARINTANCTLVLHISWRHPKSDLPIEFYEFVYNVTLSSEESQAKQMSDSVNKPVEIKINKTTSYKLEGLRPRTAYEMRLFAVSQAGRGIPAFIEIITPPILPCGSDKDPEPPDVDDGRGITRDSSTVFIPIEGSTSKETSTPHIPKKTDSIATGTSNTINHSPRHKPNIYRTVYYTVYVIYNVLLNL